MLTGLALLGAIGVLAATPLLTSAATQPPQGSWTTYGVLSNTGVTNTGPSVVHGNVGSSGNSSATAVTGFPPGVVIGGSIILGGAAITAQTDATAAVNALESQISSCTTLSGDLGGRNLVPGVYCFTAGLTGTLILNGGADPNAVFIFLTPNNLIVNPNASVVLIGSSTCNVYWRTNALASLDTNVSFIGTIFASSQVTMNSGAKLIGRAIAQTANVTLINNTITSGCVAGLPGPGATQTAVSGATQTPAPPPPSCVGNIRGRKQDGSGTGLPGWTIQLIQNGQVVQSTSTDSSGNFNFLGLPKGSYTIREVSQSGWTAQGATSFDVTISSCDQNATGYTFVNTLASSASTSTPTAVGSGTAVPASGTPGARATSTPAVPTGLPNTGGSPPWTMGIAVLVGALLAGVGLASLRRNQGSRTDN